MSIFKLVKVNTFTVGTSESITSGVTYNALVRKGDQALVARAKETTADKAVVTAARKAANEAFALKVVVRQEALTISMEWKLIKQLTIPVSQWSRHLMSSLVLMLILSSPITLMPLMHLVTGYEGNYLLVTTVFTLIVLLVLTIILENCNE